MRVSLERRAHEVARATLPEVTRASLFSPAAGESVEFQRLSKHFRRYAPMLNPDRTGIYTLGLVEGKLRFGPESFLPDHPMASPPGAIYERPPAAAWQAFKAGIPVTYGPYTDEYGSFVTALAPVVDAVSGEILFVIGIDVEAKDWSAQLWRLRLEVGFGVLILSSFVFMTWLLLRWRAAHSDGTPGWMGHIETVSVVILGLLITAGVTRLVRDDERLQHRQHFDEVSMLKIETILEAFHNVRRRLVMVANYHLLGFDSSKGEVPNFVTEPGLEEIAWFESKADSSGNRTYVRTSTTHDGREGDNLLSVAAGQAAMEGFSRLLIGSRGSDIWLFVPPDSDQGMPSDGVLGARFSADKVLQRSPEIAEIRANPLEFKFVRLSDMNATRSPGSEAASVMKDPKGFRRTMPFFFSGETFCVVVAPDQSFFDVNPMRAAWITAVAGLCFSMLMGVVTAAFRARQNKLDGIVKDRTASLLRRSRLLRLLTRLALRFVNLPTERVDTELQLALAETGDFFDVDRAYLFLYDHEKRIMTNTHEWCREGIEPMITVLQAVRIDISPEMLESHIKGQIFILPDVEKLPATDPNRDFLLSQSIRTLVAVPMMDENRCIGFFGFDAVRFRREWTTEEIIMLQVLAELYGNVDRRIRAGEERQRLEDQLLRSQRMESLGRLAGGVAHELNNVLSPVLLGTGILRDGMTDASKLSILDLMESSASRGAGIIRQILTFARGDSGERHAVDIGPLIKRTCDVIRQTLPKTISLVSDIPPSLSRIVVNKTGIEQVLMNLCINARDAMPEGGMISVRVFQTHVDALLAERHHGAAEGDYLCIAVKDTGTGIDPEVMPQIFDPFFTTKEQEKGTGLGLSVLQGIVEAHSGFVVVESKSREGSLFRVYLPQDASERTESAAVDFTPVIGVQKAGTGVLIVDDEQSIRTILEVLLEQQGYEVFSAESGEPAFRLWKDHRDAIDLVITDLAMPGVDGSLLVQRLRKAGCTVPIIIMTGLLPQAESRSNFMGEVSAVISKPVQSDILLAEIVRVLAESSESCVGESEALVSDN